MSQYHAGRSPLLLLLLLLLPVTDLDNIPVRLPTYITFPFEIRLLHGSADVASCGEEKEEEEEPDMISTLSFFFTGDAVKRSCV
jgi:hypothetical protein